MANPLRQPPLDRYFVSPTIPHVPKKEKRVPSVTGIARFVKNTKGPEKENGLFVAGTVDEEGLRRAFAGCGRISSVSVFARYAFVVFDGDVDIACIVGRKHNIGGRMVYVDEIRGSDPYFIPVGKRRRTNLWHNYSDKFG